MLSSPAVADATLLRQTIAYLKRRGADYAEARHVNEQTRVARTSSMVLETPP